MRYSIYRGSGLVNAGLALIVSVVVSGCATSNTPDPFTDAPPADASDSRAWSPDEILRPEIVSRGSTDHTAMALVQRLRPSWLRARGQKSFADESVMYAVVYIDEIRHGELRTLHAIPASEVLSMQFFSTADATTRWGTGHPSGVINIVTGR